MKLRKWILRIHLYGGLVCFFYLIIFAVSSLHYHHDFDFMKSEGDFVLIERKLIRMPQVTSDSSMAENIREKLKIAGHFLPWKTGWNENGLFYTQIDNSKSFYRLKYDTQTSVAEIEKKDKGIWSAFNALHGFTRTLPGASWMAVWAAYTYVCLFVVIFSVFSGIWLWIRSARFNQRVILGFCLLTLALTSIMLMTYYFG